jgi:hypothetical protein
MSSSSDPLLRAIQRGDPNCPDGASLARLGKLARAAGANHSVDLSERVRRSLADGAAAGSDGDAAVDAWMGGTADPVLDRLHALTHGQPRPVDLRDRVRRALAPASLRLSPQQAERTGRRWRLVAAIAAAHVAAILVFTTIADSTPSGSGVGGAAAANRSRETMITAPNWESLRERGGDVLAPRRSSLARETARADARLGDTAAPVAHMLAWLIARQDPVSGRIATGNGDRAVASQAFAALALLGEGAGDQTRLNRARLALGPVAAAMAGTEPLSPATLSAAALALVEGALVTRDPELTLTARAGLLRLTRELPGSPHEGGLAGLAWLALETAETGKLEPPRGAIEAARNRIARPLPAVRTGDTDLGRLGLAAYARIVLGLGGQETTQTQLAALTSTPPVADRDGRIDPLAWFLAGLAMHAQGGPGWTAWAEGLRASIPPRLVPSGPSQARLPADSVRFAGGDEVLATALGVLALQAPYRYAVPAAN